MTLTGGNLADAAEHELRLPEIDGERCVYADFEKSSCQACVDACPSKAWILSDDSLGLDTQACNGCGLCVPACPPGALHIEFPWVIRHFCGKALALFACERSDVNGTSGIMPCIHALGTRQLMVLHTAGITNLLVSEGNCKDCLLLDQNESLAQRIEQLNRLLTQRNLVPIKLLSYSNTVWRKIHRQEEVISKGTLLKRRAFLGGVTPTQNLQQQLIVLDPLNRSECQTIPPGSLLPEPEVEHDNLWPWAPQLDPLKCNGCNACIQLCPTDALEQHSQDTKSEYLIQAKYCTGCNICTDVCTQDAIQPTAWDTVSLQAIPLVEKQCTSCGNPFHLPADNPMTDESRCPVCSNRDQLLFRQQ